jgi:hypothetical protein
MRLERIFKISICLDVHSALVKVNEELLEIKIAALV